MHHYFQPVYWSDVAGVPITYVLTLHDRPSHRHPGGHGAPTPPPFKVNRVDSGHLLPVTSPGLFAEIVNRVAG